MADPLRCSSTERKTVDTTPTVPEPMSDAELERILMESLGHLEIEEEKGQAAASIPVPESASVSEKEMMKQQIRMMFSAMAEAFSCDPNQVRQMIQMQMQMMGMGRESLEETVAIPIPVSELTGDASDERMVMMDLSKMIQHPDIQDEQLSAKKFEELLADKTFTLISKDEVEHKAKAMQQGVMASPLELPANPEAQAEMSKMLHVFGINEKHHAALLTKGDLPIEIQLAQHYATSLHSDLVDCFVEFQVYTAEAMFSGSAEPVSGDALSKHCKGTQFAQIGHEMTQYLVAHYKLGS
ncbi:MAG: hypothetical protein KFB93_06315 [Simkaniaceae bacterium]|nr:MAG: hypothetical protein KFB93_06315 [Simkaniaceae bacterium]